MPNQIDVPAVQVKPCGCPEGQALSRRSFLKRSATAGIVAGIAADGLFTRLAFAAGGTYSGDTLVVLSLRGGFDGLNAIVPAGDPHYLTWRPDIGIHNADLLTLDSMFGMHKAMGSLKPFYDAGNFGVMHAVGMSEPNRSHFSAMEEMERAAPGNSLRTGWLDRVLGLRTEEGPFQATQIGSSASSQQFLGPSPELAMWSVDSFQLEGSSGSGRLLWDAALRSLHKGAPTVVEQPANTALDALSTAAALQASGYTPANGAAYPADSGLADALKDVARLIKADVGLQVAAVDYGNWDMHSDMGTPDAGWMHDQLTELSDSLSAFATDLGTEMDDVTLLTLTEFGRRVEQNGSAGVDHGYGQAVLLLGNGIKGGKVHGNWPTLAPDKLVDGDVDGSHQDYRKVLAEILEKRCGAGSSDIQSVFPGLDSQRFGVAKVKT